MTIAPKLSFDLKGLLCPVPVFKIAQAVQQVKVGEEIEAIATDPELMTEIPAWANRTGNQVVKLEECGDHIHFVVRRLK